MSLDPFRFAVATIPLAAYLLVLGLINLRRRPFLTWGSNDLAALGITLSGFVFIGPIELFRPEAATIEMGNTIWLALLIFYLLWVWMFVLLGRPRLVVYNISGEELHAALAEAAAQLDPEARWAGESLSLPNLGVQMHLDCFPLMRNVSIKSSGPHQNLAGWRKFGIQVAEKLSTIPVQSNPRAISLFLAALILVVTALAHLLQNKAELIEAMREVFVY